MLLAVDIGNTQSVFALFDGDTLLRQWRMATQTSRSSDEYGIWLLQAFAQLDLGADDIDAVMIATVVPDTQFAMLSCCKHYFDVTPMIVGADPMALNITIDIDAPDTIGADRLINAVEAWKRHQCGLVVIDFGTATTFDVVTESGTYCGGVIAPGVNLSLKALQQAAAKLPSIRIRAPKHAIGRNTISAMESGLFFGYISLIEGVLARIQQEQPGCRYVIATGGLASLYAPHCDMIDVHDADLTMYGLRSLYALNS